MSLAVQVLKTGPLDVNTLVVPLCRNKVFVVDPAACELSFDENSITDYLHSHNLDCIAVVLTHAHFDHITGIDRVLSAFPSAKIAIHKADSKELLQGQNKMNSWVLRSFGMEEYLPVVKRQPLPNVLLHDGDSLEVLLPNADSDVLVELKKWRVLLTPGHTPGSICILNKEEGVLLSGDTLFDGGFGRTDMYGGDEPELLKSLRRLRDEIPAGTYVYPGHDGSFLYQS